MKKNNMLREKRKHANYKPNRRLDAKSSRGMIYENEELRIRTININAEVEKGQSEIKTLKREREQLRREIWTLRDEYDKLENLLRNKGIDPDEFRNEVINNQDRNEDDEDDEEENSDGSDCCSCESCCSEGCSGGCEHEKSEQESSTCDESTVKPSAPPCSELGENSKKEEKSSNDDHGKRVGGKDRLKLNFDHLSVVAEAEESSEVSSLQGSLTNQSNEIATTPMGDLSAFLHNVDVLSPLSYLQKLSPPLSHFESLCENMSYDQIDDTKKASVQTAPVVKHMNSIEFQVKQGTPDDQEPPRKESRIKHFFSPIRKKISQPDVLISTALPMPDIQPSSSTTFIQQINERSTATIEDNAIVPSTFQTGGNLEELLHDIEALSKGIAELQTNCTELPKENGLAEVKKKPFRSELNLVLSYPSDLNPSADTPSSPIESSDLPSPIYTPLSVLTQQPQPLSPITPPINFKSTDLNFVPVNANVPIFSSNSSIFCTVSAPSTPALERKFMDRFHSTESNLAVDKKKQKRVSIINEAKDEKSSTADSAVVKKDCKEQNSTHHSHIHKNHSHSHSQPKRRMSLDNSTQKTKHKNHRQICPETKVNRRESNRSNASFKKRSDNAFGEDQGGTSMSERYSNSLASSRESSTSLSVKSGKRRISITSYGNSKKIPWCACWGNSCI